MKKYTSLDGLRAFLAIGIVLMHVCENSKYSINNYIYTNIIPEFTQFVYLFMIISGFAMCCGYYDKIKQGIIKPNDFYQKRIAKILPFFIIVVCIEIIYERTYESLIEGFTNTTLLFSLLPNPKINVIGVGWFVGVVFMFYIFFPFFVFLLDNKRRGWIALIISILLNFVCTGYFFTENYVIGNFTNRHNFLYDLPYFISGGLIYLYRDIIVKSVQNKKYLYLIISIFGAILYFVIPNIKYLFTIKIIVVFSFWLIYAIGTNGVVLNNKFTKFISNISLEIYLSHMIVFRIIQKIGISNLIYVDVISYIITSILTILGTIGFVVLINKFIGILKHSIKLLEEK